MKHNLGKLIYHFSILLLFPMLLHAEDFSYFIKASKHEVYLHEPLQLTIDLKQTNPDVVLLFRFTIDKSPDYAITPLVSKYADTLHHINQHMVYKIYPLKTGDINISFSLIKRVTTDDKVRYFASGDRDDFKKLETIDSAIEIPKVPIKVKPLPEGTQLVGDFNLSYHVNTHHTSSFSPINMNITIKGRGYPPHLNKLIPQSTKYTLFREKPTTKTVSKTNEVHIVSRYLFALSAQKSFTLAPITIQAFNPYTKEPYSLHIPEQKFTIDAVDTSSLLDATDSPALLKADWSWIQTLFGYIVVFGAGYLSAISLKWTKKKKHKEHHPLIDKIQEAKTEKALLRVLMSTESNVFTSCIEQLEDALYRQQSVNLKQLKKEALEKIV